jgi:hypothetical protein
MTRPPKAVVTKKRTVFVYSQLWKASETALEVGRSAHQGCSWLLCRAPSRRPSYRAADVSKLGQAGAIAAAATCRRGLAKRFYNQPLQSRIANTTIMVIAESSTVGAILRYRWWARRTADSS